MHALRRGAAACAYFLVYLTELTAVDPWHTFIIKLAGTFALAGVLYAVLPFQCMKMLVCNSILCERSSDVYRIEDSSRLWCAVLERRWMQLDGN